MTKVLKGLRAALQQPVSGRGDGTFSASGRGRISESCSDMMWNRRKALLLHIFNYNKLFPLKQHSVSALMKENIQK